MEVNMSSEELRSKVLEELVKTNEIPLAKLLANLADEAWERIYNRLVSMEVDYSVVSYRPVMRMN